MIVRNGKVVVGGMYEKVISNMPGSVDILLEQDLTTAGTYPLSRNVNDYDFIIIHHGYSNYAIQGDVLSKLEVSKLDSSRYAVVNHGNSNASYQSVFYFNNASIVVTSVVTEYITSIIGVKLGTVRLVNEIKSPLPSESYSTEEQLTGGTWIDGKPIYRRVIDIRGKTHNTDIEDFSFCDTVIKNEAFGSNSSNEIASNVDNSTVNILVRFNTVRKKLHLYCVGYTPLYAILEYTKTTD